MALGIESHTGDNNQVDLPRFRLLPIWLRLPNAKSPLLQRCRTGIAQQPQIIAHHQRQKKTLLLMPALDESRRLHLAGQRMIKRYLLSGLKQRRLL